MYTKSISYYIDRTQNLNSCCYCRHCCRHHHPHTRRLSLSFCSSQFICRSRIYLPQYIHFVYRHIVSTNSVAIALVWHIWNTWDGILVNSISCNSNNNRRVAKNQINRITSVKMSSVCKNTSTHTQTHTHRGRERFILYADFRMHSAHRNVLPLCNAVQYSVRCTPLCHAHAHTCPHISSELLSSPVSDWGERIVGQMDGWVGHRNAYNQFLVALILICTQNNCNIFDECLEQCGRCAIQSEVHAMCVCVSIVKSVFVVSFELDTHTQRTTTATTTTTSQVKWFQFYFVGASSMGLI